MTASAMGISIPQTTKLLGAVLPESRHAPLEKSGKPVASSSSGQWWTVRHCFARSSATGMLQHCLPHVRQWHTLVRNPG